MKKLSFIFFIFLYATQIHAALPPLFQTADEIKAIMEDKNLGQKLHSGEFIRLVEKNGEGYRITTNQHELQVNVLYEQAQQPGPRQFNLQFNEPIPLTYQPYS